MCKKFHLVVLNLLIFFLCCASFIDTICQQADDIQSLSIRLDKLYGLDPLLYTGIAYTQNQTVVYGFPFLDEQTTSDCHIKLSGLTYENILLRYDVYQHVFVLHYKNSIGANSQLILNETNIDTVNLRGKVFVKNVHSEIRQPFVQVICDSNFTALIGYLKYYKFNGMGTRVGYEFSRLVKQLYIERADKIHFVQNRRAFIQYFSTQYRKEVRRFIKTNAISFKQFDDVDIIKLLTFCNSLDVS